MPRAQSTSSTALVPYTAPVASRSNALIVRPKPGPLVTFSPSPTKTSPRRSRLHRAVYTPRRSPKKKAVSSGQTSATSSTPQSSGQQQRSKAFPQGISVEDAIDVDSPSPPGSPTPASPESVRRWRDSVRSPSISFTVPDEFDVGSIATDTTYQFTDQADRRVPLRDPRPRDPRNAEVSPLAPSCMPPPLPAHLLEPSASLAALIKAWAEPAGKAEVDEKPAVAVEVLSTLVSTLFGMNEVQLEKISRPLDFSPARASEWTDFLRINVQRTLFAFLEDFPSSSPSGNKRGSRGVRMGDWYASHKDTSRRDVSMLKRGTTLQQAERLVARLSKVWMVESEHVLAKLIAYIPTIDEDQFLDALRHIILLMERLITDAW